MSTVELSQSIWQGLTHAQLNFWSPRAADAGRYGRVCRSTGHPTEHFSEYRRLTVKAVKDACGLHCGVLKLW